MSFLGMGRQQPTSEQKIAAVEGEMRMMADTYSRYVLPLSSHRTDVTSFVPVHRFLGALYNC
jgi:hypothetical protein